MLNVKTGNFKTSESVENGFVTQISIDDLDFETRQSCNLPWISGKDDCSLK